ncbi:trypsin-like serine protease [Pseudomonas sp. FP2335]|uniref:trypsin-like serine protease n=1 Tax=Pseudomonas sp. FP2335 TaxID=2954092 RepID=UPI0027363666|nr:trypsin-like serine protease [Pseudomonas sp. FP2335]WLH77929.1 trypsin-like serine protease [Pseudomonas sp. FP2335]
MAACFSRLRALSAASIGSASAVFLVLSFFLTFAAPALAQDEGGFEREFAKDRLVDSFNSFQAHQDAAAWLSNAARMGSAALENQAAVRLKRGGGENQQTIEPDPIGSPIVNGAPQHQPINRGRVMGCGSSVGELRGLVPLPRDRKYAVTLVALDRGCLDDSGSAPNVPNPEIPKRSVVVMAYQGRAFCTGMLLDERTLMTARHCFIRQTDGKVRDEFRSALPSTITIQSVDLKRRVVVSNADIERLQVFKRFDIDQDPVRVPALTLREPGAEALPEALYKTPQAEQLLWIGGPFALLDEALAMLEPSRSVATGTARPSWLDAFRWSAADAAQCRVQAVGPACIYHTCQTSKGFSGSPMILSAYEKANGQGAVIEYVGVHSGTPGFDEDEGWPACAESSGSFDGSMYSAFNVGKNGGL